MRIIKFRAWDAEESEMIEWFPQFFSDMSVVTEYGNDFPVNGSVITLMQFTGLHDKDGSEIYDGDILSFKHTPNAIVFWPYEDSCVINISAGWKGKYIGLEGGFSEFYLDNSIHFLANVIGNIFQNKELLK